MNNIIKRKWNKNSMVIIEDLQGMAFQAESGGHTFQISGIDGEGNTVALSGTPAGVMLRADGQDVALTCSVSGGVVSATLPANAYSVPGRFGLTIFLTSDGQKTAIYAAVGTISKTSSGTVAPPAGSDVVDLVNAIAAAVATIPASYTDLMASMAPTYSSSGLYAVGSYAWYNGKLYRCTTPITSGETWTSGHWTLANLGSDLVDLKSAMGDLANAVDAVLLYQYSETRVASYRFPLEVAKTILPHCWFDDLRFQLHLYGNTQQTGNDTHNTIIANWGTTRENYISALAQATDKYIGVLFRYSNNSAIDYNDIYFGYKWETENIINYGLKYPKIDTNLTQYSPTRLASKIFPSSQKAELMQLWLSDPTNYDIYVARSNNADMSKSSICTNWGESYATYKYKLGYYTDAYFQCYFAVRSDRTQPINVGDVYFSLQDGNDVQNEIIKINQKVDAEIKSQNPYEGKTFAVMCDSIGTHGNSGTWNNVPELIVTAEDVGHELSAYVTYYDLYTNINHDTGLGTFTGMTIGGLNLDSDSYIGQEITFTPTADDIGKSLGKVFDWNGNSLDVWWAKFANETGMTPIPVCWASSSYCSHEESTLRLKGAYAWHDSQIRKCGIRTAGSMTRKAPDYIILARGCNDLTHTPYARLTTDFFDELDWDFPQTDVIGTNLYGLKEALSLTIKKIWAAYPNTKIVLCTINYLGRIDYNNFPTNNDNTNYPQWNDAIREVADYFGCGLIDFSKDGITHANLTTYVPDRTHPNAFGHELMAKRALQDFKG